ncbi:MULTISPECIES: ABC transporter ATP-binding protein [Rhizobium]|uniref:ABC transporter ATP-binding protein n=1 Tax=Rhizobium leguminosarum bv. viciae TaxID=387 RepID=A0A8G2IUD4_RHILV|nr:ABC transporter ATP-binding protein [Rhizobium leguminosarum]MBY5323839.1 ABC transporter ATP-binding protein [Rhizobium leguminosarum]MBY5384056.1 ABC transporter ATP-binding protein [Rhizobium leguminosarum]MBY5426304.1 ABC transporter ATP-binding protein [Rhizobium leguminosarum]MCA2435794.1 ABC transporter ATP-binding protein [Rhizobium leguminosarum]NEH45553.1 ATP-binding cassette domain-containing protein [Rhizobium leguminosarum]
MTGPVLEIIGVSKRFGDNLANDDISMTLAKGEVVALLGENGAGKTTLMSILFGHYMPDAGRILIEGTEVPQGKPRAAIRAGVGMVHQHFSLAPNLTVLENVMTGTERLWSWRSGTSAARKKLLTISERFGLKVDPDARLGDLSVGEQQRVEILKALYNDARILILDEPTAVLTNIEAERLFTTLREMARQGLSLIFISHKLDEVMAAADRIVVLRGGKMVAERKASDTSKAELAELMVGRLVTRPVRESSTPGAVALEAVDVTVRSGGVDRLKSISFRLHQGEILGIIGVSGNGQAALAHLLSGIVARSGGDLLLFGESVGNHGVSDVVDAGIGRIPEDRNEEGVIGEMAIWENAVLERIASPAFSRHGLVNRKAGMAFASEIIDGFDVRGGGPAIRTRLLSGGNMQKLILGRNLHRRPRILIAAQPARGLDEGAVAAVHARLLEARRQGTAVLLISEDLDEVIALADRIQAIVGGRLSPPVEAESADARRLGLMMAGEWQENPEAGHAI